MCCRGKKRGEKKNEEAGGIVQVRSVAKLAAWLNVGITPLAHVFCREVGDMWLRGCYKEDGSLWSWWQGRATYHFKGALVLQPFRTQEDPVVPEAQVAHVATAQLHKMCPYFVIHPERE